ncbi:hypothetical protein [Nonomuraea gerenzanensis]|uniref:Uncharacterized protein n=1 Tax=Nonomuraea gerenzanensis TaxID=93944 RepID=A0A1M4BLB2_9ACTN|nr:hypothetical protein [Nonomuraea gerenzanensis]UBU10042.1 hypothetical protein LCN96_37575 [Nonomuraea gerenzanensis]SAP16334.1 hypothetical protein BN4615_P10997 [Nonomuraea gerenzanensis]
MPDSPTPWELHRTMEALRHSMEAGFASLNARLDRVVSSELFAAYQQHVQKEFDDHERELAAIKAEREADKKERDAERAQRATDRRMAAIAVFTSIIAPLVILLISVWLNSGRT